MANTDAFLFWIAAFFFVLATVYLIKRIKKEDLAIFYPISTYLGSIAAFFIFMGISAIYDVKFVTFLAVLAIMFGASSITRFPVRLLIPNQSNQKFIYYFLLIVAGFLALYNLFFSSIETQLRVAHTFAFITAGLFTIGYILFMGIKTENRDAKKKSIGSGVSLGLCCVVSHGLMTFQLLPLVAVPLFGVFSLKLPLLFAILSPISFMLVLYLGHRMQRTEEREEVEVLKGKFSKPANVNMKIVDKSKLEVENNEDVIKGGNDKPKGKKVKKDEKK